MNLVRMHGTTQWHARTGRHPNRIRAAGHGARAVLPTLGVLARPWKTTTTEREDPMMTEQTYNVALLRKVREQILHHPETHEQASWVKTVTLELPEAAAGAAQCPTGARYFRHMHKVACGTTACVAGWAVQLAGWEPVQEDIQAWADGVYTHHTFRVTEEPGAEPQPIRSVAGVCWGSTRPTPTPCSTRTTPGTTCWARWPTTSIGARLRSGPLPGPESIGGT